MRGNAPRSACGRALQNLQHLRIGKAAFGMDDGGMKFRTQHATVVRDEKFHALRQAIHVRLERAQFIAQRFRQHRDDAIHEIGGIAAFLRFHVKWSAGLDVM